MIAEHTTNESNLKASYKWTIIVNQLIAKQDSYVHTNLHDSSVITDIVKRL